MSLIHFLRVAASFALLGAVIGGVASGTANRHLFDSGVDLRLAGAILGFVVGVVMAKHQREDHPAL